jgi:hypothetical protein
MPAAPPCCRAEAEYNAAWPSRFYIFRSAEVTGPQVRVAFDASATKPPADHTDRVLWTLGTLTKDVLVYRTFEVDVVAFGCGRGKGQHQHPGAMTVTLDCSPAAPGGYTMTPFGWYEKPPSWAQAEAAKRARTAVKPSSPKVP